MSYLLQAGDIIKVSFITLDADQAGINTHYRQVTAVGGGGVTDQGMVNEYDTVLAPRIKPLLNNNAEYQGIILQALHNITWMAPVFSVAGDGPGTGGATALPRQVAGFLRMRTELGGRRSRGRMYIPFPATAHDTGNGFPSSAYLTALGVLSDEALLNYTEFGTPPNYVDAAMVIFHRAGKSPTPAPTRVTAIDNVAKWATQRRRGSFGRPNVSPIP